MIAGFWLRLAGAALWTLCALAPAKAGDRVLVFAAASLKNALEEAIAPWEAATGHDAALSFAGSSVLARQIELGAPADMFLSANPEWMDRLERGGHLRAGSRRDLFGNRLVLACKAPAGPVDLAVPGALTAALGDRPLAIALADAVPAGIYAKAALSHYGLWETLAPRAAQADNVRAALALVARGEAACGVVYVTDAASEAAIAIAAEFPTESHPPILYPAALTAEAGETAGDLLTYLSGPEARAVFVRWGFLTLERGE